MAQLGPETLPQPAAAQQPLTIAKALHINPNQFKHRLNQSQYVLETNTIFKLLNFDIKWETRLALQIVS